jgi:DNA-binding MarR family transcriptional regulator
MHETSDSLRDERLLTLGSRFRRLGERLQSDTQAILADFDDRVAVSWHPLLNLLDTGGGQTIGQISAALGLAQPGITRAVAGLAEIGLVTVTTADTDRRIRIVGLSPEGRDFVTRARSEVWPRVEGAVADLCSGFGEDLLTLIGRVEDRLAEKPLRDRVGQGVG